MMHKICQKMNWLLFPRAFNSLLRNRTKPLLPFNFLRSWSVSRLALGCEQWSLQSFRRERGVCYVQGEGKGAAKLRAGRVDLGLTVSEVQSVDGRVPGSGPRVRWLITGKGQWRKALRSWRGQETQRGREWAKGRRDDAPSRASPGTHLPHHTPPAYSDHPVVQTRMG